jgi:DNA-binding transcriptional LysR family regulator
MAVRGEGIAGDMFERLAAGELDAAFCLLAGEPPEEFAIERLSEDEAVAAFAPDRAPAEGDVGVAELSGQVLVGPRRGSAITFALDQVFAAAGQPLHLALESGDPFLLVRSPPRASALRSCPAR